MKQRYEDRADVVYHDVSQPQVREKNAETVNRIQEEGFIYPVTFVDGQPLYDGAVSYPAIMRAVENLLAARTTQG